MEQYILNRSSLKALVALALTAFLILALIPADVEAIERVERPATLSSLEFQGSYSLGRRAEFRDLYGNGLSIAARYERSINDKVGLGVRVSRVRLSKDDMKYRDFTIAPAVTYTLAQTGPVNLFVGAAAGISFRKITVEVWRPDTFGFYEPTEYDDTELSPYGASFVGFDLALSRFMFFGLRVTYDRHLFGNPSTGDFGDSGGFCFGGALGFEL